MTCTMFQVRIIIIRSPFPEPKSGPNLKSEDLITGAVRRRVLLVPDKLNSLYITIVDSRMVYC